MNYPLAPLIDQFLKERTYLKNVTASTLVWYQVAFKNYRASLADGAPSLPTKASLQQFVVRERERGVRPVTVNTYIGAMNAFCVWLREEGHIPAPVKLQKLPSSGGCCNCWSPFSCWPPASSPWLKFVSFPCSACGV